MFGTHESFFDFTDLIFVTPRWAVVQGVDTKWDEVLLTISIMHQDSVFESQYKAWIRDFEHFNKVFCFVRSGHRAEGRSPKLSEVAEDV